MSLEDEQKGTGDAPASRQPMEVAEGGLRFAVEDDTMRIFQQGDYELHHAKLVHAELERMLEQHQHIYLLIDQSRAGNITPETRRFVSDWHRTHKVGGIALYGGTLMSRAASMLLLSVVRLLQPGAVPTIFAKDEAEGRAWIANRRREYAASKRKITLK